MGRKKRKGGRRTHYGVAYKTKRGVHMKSSVSHKSAVKRAQRIHTKTGRKTVAFRAKVIKRFDK